MEIDFAYFDRSLLQLTPRLSKLKLCLFFVISSECKIQESGKCRHSDKEMRKLVAPLVGRFVHPFSIERVLRALHRRKLIFVSDRSAERYTIQIKELKRKGPGYEGIKVPMEAMANPNLSHVAKLAFGRIHSLLQKQTHLTLTNDRLVEDLNVRRRTMESAIPELEKQKYICIQNAGTRWRKITLYPRWRKIHALILRHYQDIQWEIQYERDEEGDEEADY
jgi:hypothetical protein